ncbi:hypothetical protein QYE76_010297 [Lolium multiflorum]|uniref:Uncharacterized protein n=1 Tax=Lolium multiflorum TaxID=4521 RepID=A0AAD8TX05_LOLMU|nr:hypothetical protein QYE76_010297 [Lolium multiflorum]
MLDKFRAEVVDSSSDEESDQSTQTLATSAASILHEYNSKQAPVHRGSVKGRSKNLPRNRVEGNLRLHKDYFHRTDPVFKEKMFRRRDRMSRDLFMVILRGVRNYDPYFQSRPDAIGALGFTSYQKCSATIRCYHMEWLLIYSMSIFEWTARNPNSEKTMRFAKMQEACMKDVERGFCVLQARWEIVRHQSRTWSLKTMREVMTCCVIMHNMIVENERVDGRNNNHWVFKEIFTELNEINAHDLIFHGSFQRAREGPDGSPGGPTPPGGAAKGGAPLLSGSTRTPPRLPFRL